MRKKFNEESYDEPNDKPKKELIYPNRKKFEQVIFLTGGKCSGKVFAIKHLIESSSYSIFDSNIFNTMGTHSEKNKVLSDFIKANTRSVSKDFNFTLYNTTEKIKAYINKHKPFEPRLPNILIDITLEKLSDLTDYLPMLKELGYDSKNIHIIWILRKYISAYELNLSEEKVIPDDIFLASHIGAAKNMDSILQGNIPEGIDGEIDVILGDKCSTIGNNSENYKIIEVTDFVYEKVKACGEKTDKSKYENIIKIWMENFIPANTFDSSNRAPEYEMKLTRQLKGKDNVRHKA